MSIIGLDLGGTKMTAGLVSKGKVTHITSCQTNARGTIKEILSQITGLLDELVTAGTKAIGAGVPALVDGQGVAYEAVNMPAWKKVPLKKILESKYKLRVSVNNDANCFVLGEKYFGKGKKYSNIAGVTIGTGMGTGLIIDGKLHIGASGGAGEFGQIKYLDGITEDYSSGRFFLKKYRMTGDKLFEQAVAGDKKAFRQSSRQARKIFEDYGYHLGKALSVIVYAVAPEIIILGGSIAKAHKFFEKSMKKSLKESSYARSYGKLKIAVSDNENMGILGAAALTVEP